MKLLIVIPQIYLLGGAEKLAYDLALKLKKRACDVSICVMYLNGSSEERERLTILENHSISVYPLALKPRNGIVNIFLGLFRLSRLIRCHNFKLLEASSVSASILCLSSQFFCNAKTILGIHHIYGSEESALLAFKIYLKLLNVSRDFGCYFISNYAKENWFKITGLKEGAVTNKVIYNCINDEFFLDTSSRIRGNSLNLAYLGRMAKYKQPDIVLDVFIELNKKLDNVSLTLSFAGKLDESVPFSKDMLAKMKEKVSLGGLSDKVFFLDQVNNVPSFLDDIDILVHPTTKEAFGLSLIEALSRNVYVICSDVEAIPEVLGDTRCTMVRDIGKEDIVDSIMDFLLLDDKTIYSIYSHNEKIFSKYNSDKRTESFLLLMADMLEGKN